MKKWMATTGWKDSLGMRHIHWLEQQPLTGAIVKVNPKTVSSFFLSVWLLCLLDSTHMHTSPPRFVVSSCMSPPQQFVFVSLLVAFHLFHSFFLVIFGDLDRLKPNERETRKHIYTQRDSRHCLCVGHKSLESGLLRRGKQELYRPT